MNVRRRRAVFPASASPDASLSQEASESAGPAGPSGSTDASALADLSLPTRPANPTGPASPSAPTVPSAAADPSEAAGPSVHGLLRSSLQDGQQGAEGEVSSAAIKSKMLTRMGAQSSTGRPNAAGSWPPTATPERRRTRRPAGGPSAARRTGAAAVRRPCRVVRARPRLVSVGALAAMAGVIGAGAVITSTSHGGETVQVTATGELPTMRPPTTPSPTAGQASASAAAAAPSVSAPPSAPTASAATHQETTGTTATASPAPGSGNGNGTNNGGTGGSGRGQTDGRSSNGGIGRNDGGTGGQDGHRGGSSRPAAARSATVTSLSRGDQLSLPGKGTADWVVFGGGYYGILSRAAISFPLIDTGRLVGVGSGKDGFDTSVSWVGGIPPFIQASKVNNRLVIPSGRSAVLTVYRGPLTGKLLVYFGGATRLSVRVKADGLQDSSYWLRLSGSASSGFATIDLSGLPDWTPATIALAGSGDRPLSLSAAVLR